MLSGIYNYFFPSPEPKHEPAPPPSLREMAEGWKYTNSQRIKYFENMTAADIEKDRVVEGMGTQYTWLCYFLRRNNDFMVQYLIMKGVNVNQPNENGEIPLIVANSW